MLGLDYLNSKKYKLVKTNQYLRKYIFTGIRKPTAEQIIVSGLNNFTFKRSNSKLVIAINESLKVPQVDTMLLSTACQLIDYGNIEMTPFPIFTYVFDYV